MASNCRIIDNLPQSAIVRKFSQTGRTYEELAEEYNTSRGTIWRILKRHDMLRHRVKRVLKTKREREALQLEGFTTSESAVST